jgi:hypothetical protein
MTGGSCLLGRILPRRDGALAMTLCPQWKPARPRTLPLRSDNPRISPIDNRSALWYHLKRYR